ncbi:hypothetical protein DQ237_10765 [Blastococcus sp. TF02-8]|uniref:hypothetical protein n=1 Tax=Blastococcus sp. TF02-8 TaxID=2250574 RepID=UPI000DE98AA7|nr:hypothetical protein [Blastococcus sp. TF02-8]RBY96323.1 hypothetical protein DQ237_10765 [Blastococcus sp. TF02-8]
MTRSRPLLLLIGALVGAGIVLAANAVLSYDGRKQIDLAGWAESRDAWDREMMPGARWATDELCTDDLPCSQAVTSDTLTMYRFADHADAVAAARRFAGEAYKSGWIVVRFEPGALDREDRQAFVGVLDCINVGITEDGVEC